MNRNWFILILLAFLCGLYACEEDTTTLDCVKSGSFTCTIDGVTFTGVTHNNLMTRKFSDFQQAGIKEMEIRALDELGNQIRLTMTDFRDSTVGDCFGAGTYNSVTSTNACDGRACLTFLAKYDIVGDTTTYSSLFVLPGAVTISSCTEDSKVVSGTFSCTLRNELNEEIVISGGVFTDMCYQIFDL